MYVQYRLYVQGCMDPKMQKGGQLESYLGAEYCTYKQCSLLGLRNKFLLPYCTCTLINYHSLSLFQPIKSESWGGNGELQLPPSPFLVRYMYSSTIIT